VPGGSQQCHRCDGNRFSPQHCVIVGSHHPDHTVDFAHDTGTVHPRAGLRPASIQLKDCTRRRVATKVVVSRYWCPGVSPFERPPTAVTLPSSNLSPARALPQPTGNSATTCPKSKPDIFPKRPGKFWQSGNHRYSDCVHRLSGLLQATEMPFEPIWVEIAGLRFSLEVERTFGTILLLYSLDVG
jgi:hypothetical protein